jgi:hypothetical protein
MSGAGAMCSGTRVDAAVNTSGEPPAGRGAAAGYWDNGTRMGGPVGPTGEGEP